VPSSALWRRPWPTSSTGKSYQTWKIYFLCHCQMVLIGRIFSPFWTGASQKSRVTQLSCTKLHSFFQIGRKFIYINKWAMLFFLASYYPVFCRRSRGEICLKNLVNETELPNEIWNRSYTSCTTCNISFFVTVRCY
jgi:hypothetical protein